MHALAAPQVRVFKLFASARRAAGRTYLHRRNLKIAFSDPWGTMVGATPHKKMKHRFTCAWSEVKDPQPKHYNNWAQPSLMG